jgi:hypothetical protein
MAWYCVTVICPSCGAQHWAVMGLQLRGVTSRAGSVAELWPSGELPPAVTRLVGDLVWCDKAKEYARIEDPGRLVLTPWHDWTGDQVEA